MNVYILHSKYGTKNIHVHCLMDEEGYMVDNVYFLTLGSVQRYCEERKFNIIQFEEEDCA